MLQVWGRIPVLVRSVVVGFLVAAAGTLPWAALFAANVKLLPSVPWSVIPASAWLWIWWKYFSGAGPPRSTSEARRVLLRANPLSSDQWAGAMGASMLATITFVFFLAVLNRLVSLPSQGLSEAERAIPQLTMVFGIIMGSIVAGIVEEGSFRGYMQGPIERRHGPVVAILVTGTVFTFVHATHSYFALTLFPFYLAAAAMYGGLAYATNSILPGVFLHAGLNLITAMQTLTTGRAEWLDTPQPKPTVWEAGPDLMFGVSVIGTLITGAATIAAYTGLAKLRRSTPPTFHSA